MKGADENQVKRFEQTLKLTYQGGRIVKGGTPFCYNNQTEENPFGTYMELQNAGELV